jgi:hypothetical protein
MSTVAPDRGGVRLLDRAGAVVRHISQTDARAMIARGEVVPLGTRRKLRAVRWTDPTPIRIPWGNVVRTPGLGEAHRERLAQGRRIWRLDRMPRSAFVDRVFTQVFRDCRPTATLNPSS